MRINRLFLSLALLLCAAAALAAQEAPDASVAKAKALFEGGSFVDAYALLVKLAPDIADVKAKEAAANCLVEIGQAEYASRNFKNAYDCFRAALKIRPANQAATQLFLKMKKEMDVSKLTNAPIVPKAPPAEATPQAEAPLPPQAAQTTPSPAQPSVAAPALATAREAPRIAQSETEIKRLNTQLQKAQAQLSAAAKSSGGTDPQAMQQIVLLLSDISTSLATQQVQVQQDPKFVALLEGVGVMLDRSNRVALDPSFVVIAAAVAFLVLAVSFIILISLARANRKLLKKELQARGSPSRVVSPASSEPRLASQSMMMLPDHSSAEAKPRLAAEGEASIRAGLLKVERLQSLHEELGAGRLRWETVASSIDMLESGLKAEILNLVEEKLDTGNIVSYDAVLPIIFPFLTDYEDFFRQKADNLARASLVSSAREISQSDPSPFGAAALLRIPEQLKARLNGADRSLVTAKLSRAVAKRIGLSAAEIDEVYRGALAHDAGYLALDANRIQRIISKREISVEDRAYIKGHVAGGLAYFGTEDLPEYMKGAILYHHERMDGTGYPEGRAGDLIPIVARIIGASETFVSLVSKRSYRDRFDTAQAVAIIQDGKGSKFDPDIVDAVAAIGARLEVAL
jgi:HD-GYP domain-containing protein (c-di-GMP phosphodiesterase class II)